MGPKGNIFVGVLVVALGVLVLMFCSSTAFQDYLVELVQNR